MWEQNPEPAPEQAVIPPTYDELAQQVAVLTEQVKNSEERRNDWANRYYNLQGKVNNLDEYLTDNWEDMGDHAEPIAELFDLEATVSKTIKWTVEIELTVSAGRGFDFESIDESDMEIDVNQRSYASGCGDWDIDGVDWSGTDIEVVD